MLTFDQIFEKFCEIYWNLVLKHQLFQQVSGHSELEQILQSIVVKYGIEAHIPYESLPPTAMLDASQQVKKRCKRYVVGALFVDTNSLFYSFSRKEEWLQINPLVYEFLCKHKQTIEKLNYYEWARFLEKANQNSTTTHILEKIDESTKRGNLDRFRQILWDEFETRNCFYCYKPLRISSKEIDVDHFIPWSFIKDDKLWNFVLACPSCNRTKKDKLPTEHYLHEIQHRNELILASSRRIDMENYKSDSLPKIYHWAFVNDFNRIWSPKKLNTI